MNARMIGILFALFILGRNEVANFRYMRPR
jgi:hypothetical protein